MSIESGEVHDWPPVTSAHASRGQPDATRSLAVRPVASIQSALLTARDSPERSRIAHVQSVLVTRLISPDPLEAHGIFLCPTLIELVLLRTDIERLQSLALALHVRVLELRDELSFLRLGLGRLEDQSADQDRQAGGVGQKREDSDRSQNHGPSF